jgi:hypothetical protein
MKTRKEIENESGKLWLNADKISDFLLEDVLEDGKIAEELQKIQESYRNRAFALWWVLDEKRKEEL